MVVGTMRRMRQRMQSGRGTGNIRIGIKGFKTIFFGRKHMYKLTYSTGHIIMGIER